MAGKIAMGRVLARILLAVSLWAEPTMADEAKSLSVLDQTAIRAVIQQQLEAFRRDDSMAAFAHAAPVIRKMFGGHETFLAMVRRDYPAVYRPRDIAFGSTGLVRGAPVQAVRLVGPKGVAVVALYAMERQPDGTWRISGCQLLMPAGKTT
jgi:hypothetical protein